MAKNEVKNNKNSVVAVEKDFNWYLKAAENGDAEAQLNVGGCYYTGDGVEQNKEEAFNWFKKSAEQGNAYAQLIVGVCYDQGDGVGANKKEAFNWYLKAAEQGNAGAQCNVGLCYDQGDGVEANKKEAFNWYLKAAENGDEKAQFNVGTCYFNGLGVTANKKEAFNWYLKAAENGDEQAQFNVGTCYFNGLGVKANKKEGFNWWRKVAEQGNAIAQSNVGFCYFKGEGVEENKEEAFQWYKKAAEQGDGYSKRFVDEWADKREYEDNYVAKSKDSFPKLDLSAIEKCFRETILESLPEIRNELQKKDKEEKMNAEGAPKVFIIHGHDEAKWRELKEILKDRFNLNPIELSEQANQGKTIIEKFEYYAKDCSYAFAIFTPDDIVSNNGKEYFQARPNVIFELGWFYSHLGRSKVCILNKGQKSEIFSDLNGILFIPFQNRILEQLSEIEKELRAAKIIN